MHACIGNIAKCYAQEYGHRLGHV